MRLPDEEIAAVEIQQAFEPQLTAANRLFEFVQQMIIGGRFDPGQRVHYCVAPVLVRLLRLHYSAVKLASVGLAAEAKMSVRATFENVVNLHSLELSQDRELYARRWIGWDLINYRRQADAVIARDAAHAPAFAEHMRLAAEVEAEIREEARQSGLPRWPNDPQRLQTYVEGRWKVFTNNGPAMKNMRDLARDVDAGTAGRTHFEQSYAVVYPNASGVVHGSDLASLIETQGNQIALILAPTEAGIETVLVTSTVWLQLGATVASRLLNIGPADREKQMEEIVRPALAGLVPPPAP